jgi:glyoxylase-like metal-dependent hydrolase (beta-lactamase superfamily II)
MERTLARSSLRDVVQPLDHATAPACLPGWETVLTPGHTPGHVAFMRSADRVAITGDALVTLDLNSPRRLLRRERTLAGPPWITTWSWPAASASAARIAGMAPSVIAGGHGAPMGGSEAAAHIQEFLRARER